MIKRAFTEHPASVGESYFEHMGMAFGFGAKMVCAGMACLLHAIFPFLFKTTGRECIADLHDRLVANRCTKAPADVDMPSLAGAADRAQPAE